MGLTTHPTPRTGCVAHLEGPGKEMDNIYDVGGEGIQYGKTDQKEKTIGKKRQHDYLDIILLDLYVFHKF